jgi:5-hydroxyisourate hydrolase
MSPITTHVLDTAKGIPAENVPIQLESWINSEWQLLARGSTNADGRLTNLLEPGSLSKGNYRISFDVEKYFSSQNIQSFFYHVVRIEFEILNPEQHYHVPLLLSPFGYSTYRGS